MLFAGPWTRRRWTVRAVGTHNLDLRGFLQVDREVIRPLEAWDRDDCSTWLLTPGALLSGCRVQRNHAPGAEPYVVEFGFGGHRYSCPLVTFQARTQAPATAVETTPAERTVAV